MKFGDLEKSLSLPDIGRDIYRLIEELYPICRSITGNGVRETLAKLKTLIPLEIREVATGTKVLDWTVPKEWNIRDAYIKDARGKRVVDFRKSNLHVVSYSVPVEATMSLDALRPHLFALPEQPDWIPYRTSYYNENWGFCLSQKKLSLLTDKEYEVRIDATLSDGNLTYGEYYLRGKRPGEVLISCHTCHPSLCNDNLSGVALVAFVAKYLSQFSLDYSYRFLFIPGTIGSITWLALNEAHVSRIKHGLVVAGVGDPGKPTYKKSRRGDAEIDKAVGHVLKHSGSAFEIMDFVPYGYDERQFCSPGFNLPVGSFMRTPWGRYAEYHTSADNLSFVQPQPLADSFAKFVSVLDVLENNESYINQNPKGEPQLGRRGLYGAIGGSKIEKRDELAMLWVLNLSDGGHSLLDIADRSNLRFDVIRQAADRLLEHGLLKERSE